MSNTVMELMEISSGELFSRGLQFDTEAHHSIVCVVKISLELEL